jgi:hypothetical protein
MKCNDGATLVEVVTALVIGATALVGLGIVYVFGLQSYESGLRRLRLQQNGSHVMAELARDIRNADSVLVDAERLVVHIPGRPDSAGIGYTITFRRDDMRLLKNDEVVVPGEQADEPVRVKFFGVETADDTVAVVITLASADDTMQFSTAVKLRNRF